MPQFRTQEYAIWCACERFAVRPPGVLKNWDDMVAWHQAQLLAFDQIRRNEEAELAMIGAMKGIF